MWKKEFRNAAWCKSKRKLKLAAAIVKRSNMFCLFVSLWSYMNKLQYILLKRNFAFWCSRFVNGVHFTYFSMYFRESLLKLNSISFYLFFQCCKRLSVQDFYNMFRVVVKLNKIVFINLKITAQKSKDWEKESHNLAKMQNAWTSFSFHDCCVVILLLMRFFNMRPFDS